MSKKNRMLRDALPSICRAITRQKGIKLIFRGPPRTDGKIIYSDPLPVDATDDQRKMIVGDIDHECGHILFTDFDLYKMRIEAVDPERRPTLHALANAIEDTQSEGNMAEKYPGCRVTLAESVELLEKEQGTEVLVADQDPGKLLANYLDTWGRVHVLEQKLEASLEAVHEAMQQQLGERNMRHLEALLNQHYFSVDSTEKTWELVDRIEQFLEEIEDDDEDQQDQQDQQNQQNQQDGDDESDGGQGDDSGDSGSSSGDSSGDGQPAEGSDTGAGGGANAKAAAQAMLQSSNVDPTPSFDRKEVAKEAAAEAAKEHYVPEPDADDSGIEGGKGGQQGGNGGDLPGVRQVDLAAYQELQESISGEVDQLTRRIIQEYQTRTRRRWISAEDGRLDHRALVRAYLGDPVVYRKRQHRQIPYPAVGLIVDTSSSMSATDIRLAKQAAVALLETNERLAVPTGLHIFGGSGAVQIKAFDQALKQVRESVAGIYPSGGTPMTEALWAAGTAIARRKEERKLLFLISDGAPNDPESAKEVAGLLEASGIEVYGLGIGSDAVAYYCSHAQTVADAGEIAAAILSALQKSMLRAA